MPELHIERRQAVIPWWVWLGGALILALLIWWIVAAATPDRRTAAVPPQERVAGTREELLPVVVIVTNPATYFDKTVSGTATVGEVVSDRGFWLRQDDRRIFAVIDEPRGETKNLNEGQWVRVSGIIYDSQRMGAAPGTQDLEADARQIIEKEPAFLYARAEDITILEGGPDQTEAVSLSAIFANPAGYLGKSASGTANVVSDVSDRGFWMEQNGTRAFAVIDEPVPETIDINDGQRIRFSGTVMDATRAAEIPGIQALQQKTRQILEEQPAFVLVPWQNITILERPS